MDRFVLGLLLLVPTALPAQRDHHSHRAATDSAFGALQARGRIAMGVDQYVSTHRFDALADGGRIELLSDRSDTTAIAAIRAHFHELAREFRAGNFSTPAFVHRDTVPGTTTMSRRRARIEYEVLDLPAGGGLRIRTTDPAALAAVHEFLGYQRREHRVPR
jgi:hypothetical protein